MQIQIFNLMLRYMIRALPPRMIYCLVLSGAKVGYASALEHSVPLQGKWQTGLLPITKDLCSLISEFLSGNTGLSTGDTGCQCLALWEPGHREMVQDNAHPPPITTAASNKAFVSDLRPLCLLSTSTNLWLTY